MKHVELEGKRIGCAMTGSFCTFREAFAAWRVLSMEGAELFPLMSFNASSLDTRFYAAKESIAIFEEITGRDVIRTIESAEPIGPKKLFDLLIVAPCTGNTLAKIANGITDTPVTLAVKSHLRNKRPVVIAISTNDGLGQSAKNLASLLATKHVYFVPFRQDNSAEKPNSLVADFTLIADTAVAALQERQIQPILC